MAAELEVLLHDRVIGHLMESTTEAWSFVYQDEGHAALKARPAALALPRVRRTHCGESVRAVFCNLLPDGQVRRRLTASLGLSTGNDFALLARIGGECHGALGLRPPGLREDVGVLRRELNDAELRSAVAVLPV